MPKIRMMGRADLLARLQTGPMFTQWHWLTWNYSQTPETPVSRLTLDALLRADAVMPGYAEAMIATLEAMGGRKKNPDDYEQIKQWLGELLVVDHFVAWPWDVPVTFSHEPTAGGSRLNPEMTVTAADWEFGIEVKTPDLRALRGGGRWANDWQMVARLAGGPASLPGSVTLPRDNPVKDFLISADKKFAAFRAENPAFYGVLFIVWDDYINEPITALLAPESGLLTDNSFHRDESGNPARYPNVDAVVLLRQQHQLELGLANDPPVDQRLHFLDYGSLDRFPPNAVIPNPHSLGTPPEPVVHALQAYLPHPHMGAEYVPGGLVMWIGGADEPPA